MTNTKVTSTFQLEPSIAKKLDIKARKEGVPKVKIVNQALKDFLLSKKTVATPS